MQSESFIILTPSYQLYCFFTCQMLDVKADGQHARKPIFNLFLQGFIMIRIVAVAKHSGHFQLLMVPSLDIINIVGPSLILDDVDSAESNHATEESCVLLRLNIILLNDTERCLIALADGINLMASQSTMEV